MLNKIKFINVESIFDKLTRNVDLTTESKIENTLSNMEFSQEFKNLFFFFEEDDHIYYYQETDEQKIKDFISQHIDISDLSDSDFEDYGQSLHDWYSGGFIQIGILQIEESDFYTMLRDDYLHSPIYVEKLVKSGKKFPNELDKFKKECLKHLVNVAVSEIKLSLKEYEFKN